MITLEAQAHWDTHASSLILEAYCSLWCDCRQVEETSDEALPFNEKSCFSGSQSL